MAKTIIKEIGIVLLLLIAVALILGILFYDYIPNNKTVPVKIQEYALSEDIQNELKGSGLQGQNIVETFYIDSTDLDLYESTNDYDKGKANPFADYSTKENTTNNTISNTENANSNTSTNTVEDISQNDENQNEVYITTPGKNY